MQVVLDKQIPAAAFLLDCTASYLRTDQLAKVTFNAEKSIKEARREAIAADERQRHVEAKLHGVTVKLQESEERAKQQRLDFANKLQENARVKRGAAEELADANRQLVDASTQLVDANTQLVDTQRQLADTQRTLADTQRDLATVTAERDAAHTAAQGSGAQLGSLLGNLLQQYTSKTDEFVKKTHDQLSTLATRMEAAETALQSSTLERNNLAAAHAHASEASLMAQMQLRARLPPANPSHVRLAYMLGLKGSDEDELASAYLECRNAWPTLDHVPSAIMQTRSMELRGAYLNEVIESSRSPDEQLQILKAIHQSETVGYWQLSDVRKVEIRGHMHLRVCLDDDNDQSFLDDSMVLQQAGRRA
ncbi:hypothetical protein CBOM_01607 [Ceraceosorus bombacis]|uniref:Uncharacterized protein n=1 Tax=Ceraceosorus bombacis TaxID=401625 RepID=A0A0P1BCV3_9BASI|nr:hypothetical protein CBOM_01607 [Ceraceosorus bombacis]